MKTSIGVGSTHESLIIVHIATDADGSLKIKKIEDFFDTKVYLEFKQAMTAAMAAQANK
jgi:hypothetical protein